MEDTTVSDELDIQDVSLIDNPIAQPTDTPSETAEAETGADTQDTPDETATEADDTPATEQPEDAQPSREDIEQQAKARAQMEYQNRQRTKQQVQQQLDQTYGPKTAEDLQDEGMDVQQAQIEALRQEMAYSQQRTQIAELNAGMQAEAVNVFNDFPVFNEKSPDYDPEFAQMVESQYQVAARLQTDENGIVINADVPLYDFYKQMNNIYSRGATKGSQQAQADAMQMLSRTDNPGGSSSTSGGGNSLDELEERLGDMVIT